MGAAFSSRTFDGKLTQDELQRAYHKYVQECISEYGTDPYNGSFSTLDRIQISQEEFPTQIAAEEHIANNTQKWEYALAVRFKDTRKTYSKQPTFGGEDTQNRLIHIHLGNECELEEPRDVYACRAVGKMVENPDPNSRVYTTMVVPADQLTNSQKLKMVKLVNEWHARREVFTRLAAEVNAICERVKVIHKEPEASDFSQLKKLHTQRKRAWTALRKAAMKLRDEDLKLSARLYKTEEVNHGTHWLVGGWCAT